MVSNINLEVMHQSMYSTPPPPPRGIAVELILNLSEIASTCIPLSHGGIFLNKFLCPQGHERRTSADNHMAISWNSPRFSVLAFDGMLFGWRHNAIVGLNGESGKILLITLLPQDFLGGNSTAIAPPRADMRQHSRQFYHILPHIGMMRYHIFLRVSLAQLCVVRMSKSHRTFTDPQ